MHFARLWSRSFLSYRIFARPLACTIRILMQKASDWKLLNEILRLDLEISPFLSNKTSKNRLTLSPQFASLVVLEKYCCSTEKAISVLLLIWFYSEGPMHPSGCVSPRQGRKKWVWAHQRSLFFLIWCILPTLEPVILELQNFPRPLACTIRILMQKASDWKLLNEILRPDLEISPFL